MIGIASISDAAKAQPASYCNLPPDTEGRIQVLERIKRENWRIFPAAEARMRTGEARQASIEFIDRWLNTCCLPRVPAAQTPQCRASAAVARREVRQWDWRSPPRN